MRKKSVNLENFKVLVEKLPQPWLQLQPVRPSWILPLLCPYTCHCKTPCVPKQFNIFMYDCSWDALLWRNYEYISMWVISEQMQIHFLGTLWLIVHQMTCMILLYLHGVKVPIDWMFRSLFLPLSNVKMYLLKYVLIGAS